MLYFTTQWKKVQIEWKDEIVTGEVKPLTIDQMIVISPHFNFSQSPSDDSARTMMLNLQRDVAPFVHEFIRNVEGVMIDDKPLDVKQLGTESVLSMLVLQFIKEAFTAGIIDKESEKNS